MVVHFSSFPTADAYLLSRWRVDSFPLSHPYSMTFQHVLFPGPCAYLGHINTAPICTIYSKLVLVRPLLAIHSCLSKTLGCKYFVTSTRLVPRLSVWRFRSHTSFSSRSPIGRKSVSSWVSPVQEAGRKEYVCVSLASLTPLDLWIFPGSPLESPLLPTDTCLWVFPCFPSLASLVSPSSPHPCFSVTLRHLILLLSLIPCTTIDFFSHWLIFTLSLSSFLLIEPYYDSFPMTHSSFHFVYKTPSTIHVFPKLFLLLPRLGSNLHPPWSPIH